MRHMYLCTHNMNSQEIMVASMSKSERKAYEKEREREQKEKERLERIKEREAADKAAAGIAPTGGSATAAGGAAGGYSSGTEAGTAAGSGSGAGKGASKAGAEGKRTEQIEAVPSLREATAVDIADMKPLKIMYLLLDGGGGAAGALGGGLDIFHI